MLVMWSHRIFRTREVDIIKGLERLSKEEIGKYQTAVGIYRLIKKDIDPRRRDRSNEAAESGNFPLPVPAERLFDIWMVMVSCTERCVHSFVNLALRIREACM